MSLPAQNNRRGNSSYNRSRNNPVQAARQEWVPRGSVATGAANVTTDTTTTRVVSPAVSGNYTNRSGHSGGENVRPIQQMNRNQIHQGPRGNGNQYVNQRRERERERERERGREKGDHEEVKVANEKKPNLPQLVQEIQEKLMKGTVECMICYDMVRRSAPIWSCSNCYSIFHLNCIKKWARAPTSFDLSAEKSQGFNWRCPGCQTVQLTSSWEIRYVCFCGKRQDPLSDLYLTPHSCGEPCGKPLEKEVLQPGICKEDLCPHVCVLQCHPGPCPPCKAFAPPRRCPCGKKVTTIRCSDRKSVLTCGERCGKLLDCGRHWCDHTCHVGTCDTCQVVVNASCFCKKRTEVVLCGDMAVKGEVRVDYGVFSCSSICEKKLSCGNHMCHETCHPGPCGECALLPGKIKTCCCGKTRLKEERQSCLDPIPTCSQTCDKSLPCEHRCQEVCHPGDCAPCPVLVIQKCRCGSTSRTVECYKTLAEYEEFTCDKLCGWKKSCGRHRCSERCCPLSNPSTSLSGDWDPHFCSMPCGKKLQCGQHSCQSLCHSGHCPPCLETIFTDLTCACGRTSISPPLPCGTPPPSCQCPCSVPQPCGHPPSHSCHFGDCPPCPLPVAKECIGGHVVLRNIPCGSKDIRCDKLCGKTRQCGLHACARICHPAPCDSSAGPSNGGRTSCGQTCGAPRRDCRHTCSALCHPGAPCPDVRCDFPITITCSCGRITATVPCDVGGGNGGYNVDTVFEASMVHKLSIPLQPVQANGKMIPLGQRKLLCDEECAKMERKKVISDAFGITPLDLDALHFGENAIVSEMLSDLLRRDPKWVLLVEERCKFLVLGRGRGGVNAPKVHVFCPLSKENRDAVRLIAGRWKLSVIAAGWEPKRFVVVHVTPKSKPPTRLLGAKGCTSTNMLQPPIFDPTVDMDPRLVVALFDLPRDADISALVLRFGAECELVWLNDKNALAVFSDPARATAAVRRLDQGSVYYGAVVIQSTGASVAVLGGNAWGVAGVAKGGGAVAAPKMHPWKKPVIQEPDWRESSLGDEEWSTYAPNMGPSVWKDKEAPIAVLANRWSVLESESTSSLFTASARAEHPEKQPETFPVSVNEPEASVSSLPPQQQEVKIDEVCDVVDDWEKAYD